MDLDINSIAQAQANRAPVAWSAILAGVAFGLAIQLITGMCGLVIGLPVSVSASPLDDVTAMPMVVAFWQGFCLLLTCFCGAWLAANLAKLQEKKEGIIYGLLSWAVTVTLMACLATTSTSYLLSGTFNQLPFLAARAGLVETPIKGSMLSVRLEAMLRMASTGTDIQNLNTHKVREWQILVEAGEREQAVAYMVRMMGFPELRSGVLVDQALILAGLPERASNQARDDIRHTVGTLNEIGLAMLLSVLASFVAAGLGGTLGTHAGRRYAHELTRSLPKKRLGA